VYTEFDTYLKRVGAEIKKVRLSKKLTQLDLAIKAEMEENAVQRIEAGRTNLTIKTLIKIALALAVELHTLLPSLFP